MATSEVINKIKIKKGEIETKLQQKFAMTSASNKPLMTFSVNDKIIGSITNKLLLNLNEEVVTALPPEVKENLILLGNATLKIEPTSEGFSPIEVDTDNNELKVHVKAKDGNKNYECRINATGIYIKYNDHETSYTPKEVEGNTQGIDITMSTRCFERMLDSKDTNIKLVRTSKSKNITTQIPSFMLGTYLEATVQQEETTREYDISENFSAFALTLPSKEGKNTYHFLKNKENGQAFAFHSGSLKPVQSFAIFTTRDENGNVKSPYLKLNVGTKANPKYAFIDLPKSNGETAVQSEYLDAVTQLKDFYDDSVKFPKPESGFSEIGKDSKGNEIIAEWASSDDERKFDTKLKGKTFTFTVEQDEKKSSPEVFNAIVENADKTDEAPIKETDNTTAVTAEPVSIEADEPEKEEKSGRERLSEETPFTSTPLKSVDMSKVKSKISPDWGVNMMLAGMVLMLVGLLFAPAFAAVFAAVGVAVTAGGAWLAVNADRLANPYLKLEQYIIDPLRKKERASEKEREAHWEKTKELNAASAKADATKENLLDTDENQDCKYWSEIFGEGYQDFINESNLLKRKAFLEELQLINNANGSEKGKMLEAFKARYGLSEDALISLFDEEKAEERSKALAAMRELNQQQEDVYNKQIDMIENTKNLNEFTFKKLCQDMKNLSPEARQVAMEQNKYALAMHLMSQKNLSQAATEQILSVLPEDCRQTLTESIAEISKISEQVDEIVHESALRTQEHQKTLDYAETLKDIHSSKTPFGSPTRVGKAALSFLYANSTSDVQKFNHIQKLTFDDKDLAQTIGDSLITLNAKETTENSLGDLLTKQQKILTEKIGLKTLGEAVLTDGIQTEVLKQLDNSADSLEALHSRPVEVEKVDILYALRHLPSAEDMVDVESEFNLIDKDIEQVIAKSIKLDKLKERVENAPSTAKLKVEDEVLNEFMTNENLEIFTQEQKEALAHLTISDDPAIREIAEMAKNGTLIPALKAQYLMKANNLSQTDSTSQGLLKKAVEVRQEIERYEATQKTLCRLTKIEQEKINIKNPESYDELQKAVEETIGEITRKNVDGKTIADAVKEGHLKEQKDINLGIDKQGKQKLLTIEKMVGKDQVKVLEDTSVQALKKQNNITDTHEIGKIQEVKKGRSVDEDVSAKEKWSSKNFHKTEEKYDTRTQLRKEGLQKLTEIMEMPDDTGKERINALSEYLGSFPVDTPTPFDAPDLSAKGFDFNKWAEKVVKQVKNKQKIDDQDMAEVIAHMAGFKRVTSKTTSAETIAKNAAIFTEAVKEKSASSKTSEEEEGKENITEKEADEKRFNPFKLKGPQERESD